MDPLQGPEAAAQDPAPTVVADAGSRPPIELPGDALGPYKLLSVIGEGGFGTVWLAERREPFTQRVALKIIKPGMDSRTVIARFEQERQALAVMDHPNVAKVLDGGITPQGRPYFVMEHVKGEPITTFCDRHRLTIRQRLELFIPVCEAVQHAHMKGIIHRDLKPSNILVGMVDTGGDTSPPRERGSSSPSLAPHQTVNGALVKVIDFGVAKAIAHTLTDKTIFTEQGMIIGTPEYMSPEQAEMGAVDIDTRADVFSLGVVLYELVAGVLPFEPRELRSKGYNEIQRVIREVEPERPSTRVSRLDGASRNHAAESRLVGLEDLIRELRRELEWIPLKSLHKDRRDRYQSAQDLAADVRRYLVGEQLIAGPRTWQYALKKVLRRHRKPLAAALVLALSLLGGSVGIFIQSLEASRQRDAARASVVKEQRASEDLVRIAVDTALRLRDQRLLRVSMFGSEEFDYFRARWSFVEQWGLTSWNPSTSGGDAACIDVGEVGDRIRAVMGTRTGRVILASTVLNPHRADQFSIAEIDAPVAAVRLSPSLENAVVVSTRGDVYRATITGPISDVRLVRDATLRLRKVEQLVCIGLANDGSMAAGWATGECSTFSPGGLERRLQTSNPALGCRLAEFSYDGRYLIRVDGRGDRVTVVRVDTGEVTASAEVPSRNWMGVGINDFRQRLFTFGDSGPMRALPFSSSPSAHREEITTSQTPATPPPAAGSTR